MKSVKLQIIYLDTIFLKEFGIKSITDYDTIVSVQTLEGIPNFLDNIKKQLDNIKTYYPVKRFNLHKTENTIQTVLQALNVLIKCLEITEIPFSVWTEKHSQKTFRYVRLSGLNILLADYIKQMSDIRTSTGTDDIPAKVINEGLIVSGDLAVGEGLAVGGKLAIGDKSVSTQHNSNTKEKIVLDYIGDILTQNYDTSDEPTKAFMKKVLLHKLNELMDEGILLSHNYNLDSDYATMKTEYDECKKYLRPDYDTATEPEKELMRIDLSKRLNELSDKGIKLTRKYDANSDYRTMKVEYQFALGFYNNYIASKNNRISNVYRPSNSKKETETIPYDKFRKYFDATVHKQTIIGSDTCIRRTHDDTLCYVIPLDNNKCYSSIKIGFSKDIKARKTFHIQIGRYAVATDCTEINNEIIPNIDGIQCILPCRYARDIQFNIIIYFEAIHKDAVATLCDNMITLDYIEEATISSQKVSELSNKKIYFSIGDGEFFIKDHVTGIVEIINPQTPHVYDIDYDSTCEKLMACNRFDVYNEFSCPFVKTKEVGKYTIGSITCCDFDMTSSAKKFLTKLCDSYMTTSVRDSPVLKLDILSYNSKQVSMPSSISFDKKYCNIVIPINHVFGNMVGPMEIIIPECLRKYDKARTMSVCMDYYGDHAELTKENNSYGDYKKPILNIGYSKRRPVSSYDSYMTIKFKIDETEFQKMYNSFNILYTIRHTEYILHCLNSQFKLKNDDLYIDFSIAK